MVIDRLPTEERIFWKQVYTSVRCQRRLTWVHAWSHVHIVRHTWHLATTYATWWLKVKENILTVIHLYIY